MNFDYLESRKENRDKASR